MDGALSGISSELGGRLQVKPNDQWMLGAASMTDPINGRFTGILDDMRFYCSSNSEQLALETYNRGNGDLSLSVDAVFPADTHDNPISASLTFKKYGIEYDVSDLNDSRITIDNGQLLSYSGSNANWTIDFNSSVNPGRVTVSLLEGVGIDDTGEASKPMSFTVGFARPMTRVDALTAWWTFDENNGTTVTDYMNGFTGQFYSGDAGISNVSFDSVNAKFGSALRFLRMHGSRPMHWPQPWALGAVIHGQFLSGCMRRMTIVVIGVPMVLGSEIVPIVLTGCGVFEVFGMGITADFAVSTGAGIPMSGYLRVLGINGCTLLIFIREQMCRSM